MMRTTILKTILPSQGDDDNEYSFRGGVVVDRTSGHVESCPRTFPASIKIHVRASCAGRSRNLSSLRSHETLECER
jgi:hypothetical protein